MTSLVPNGVAELRPPDQRYRRHLDRYWDSHTMALSWQNQILSAELIAGCVSS